MSKAKSHDYDNIQLRKQKLQEEIDSIEEKYSRQAKKINTSIQSTLKPVETIKNYPITSLGISLAVGFVVGFSGKRKKRKPASTTSASESTSRKSDKEGFSSILVGELKRMAAKRAMYFISDWVDKKVMPTLSETLTESPDNNSN